jgi:hypothetical protein
MSIVGDKLRALGYEPASGAEDIEYDADMVRQLSDLIGVELPKDYKAFLAEFPGTGFLGIEIVSAGLVKAPSVPDGLYPMGVLYASSTQENEDLLGLRRLQKQSEIPLYVLLIGNDLASDFYCMDLRPESFGKIYFWDHEQLPEDALRLLATDFTSFIGSLRKDEEPA